MPQSKTLVKTVKTFFAGLFRLVGSSKTDTLKEAAIASAVTAGTKNPTIGLAVASSATEVLDNTANKIADDIER
jgi:hypothetical protein